MAKNRFLEFKTEKTLRACLKKYGVPLKAWGKNSARSVSEVFIEYQRGERSFEIRKNVLLCHVWRVQARIFHPETNEYLAEILKVRRTGEMQYGTGEVSVSEKLLRGETPQEGFIRCLIEELGFSLDQATLVVVGEFHLTERTTLTSRTCPGLRTRRHDYIAEGIMPSSLYNPLGYREEQPRKVHYFAWLPDTVAKHKTPRA